MAPDAPPWHTTPRGDGSPRAPGGKARKIPDVETTPFAVALGRLRATWRLPGTAAGDRPRARPVRGRAVVARGGHLPRRLASRDAVSLARRSADRADHPQRHRHVNHDRGVDRGRHPADDAHPG